MNRDNKLNNPPLEKFLLDKLRGEIATLQAQVDALKANQIPEGFYLGCDGNGNPELIDEKEAIEREMDI